MHGLAVPGWIDNKEADCSRKGQSLYMVVRTDDGSIFQGEYYDDVFWYGKSDVDDLGVIVFQCRRNAEMLIEGLTAQHPDLKDKLVAVAYQPTPSVLFNS